MAATTEPPWLHKSVGVAARNGTSGHTITFATDGDAPFTPATGTLLVVTVYGPVTHTAAGGWTERLQPVNSGELSVFTITSAPTASIVLTHNASNYPILFEVKEYPAGSAWTSGAGSSIFNDTIPALTGLPGTEQVVTSILARIAGNTATNGSAVWTAPFTEDADLFTVFSGNEGCWMSSAHTINVTATSITPVITPTYTGSYGTSDRQVISYAINAAAKSGTTPFTRDYSTTWRITNAITSDYATTWRVTNAFQRDYSTTWRVTNAWTRDYATTWRVTNSFTRDYATTWRITTGFTQDYATSWRITNAFQVDYATTWNITSGTSFVRDYSTTWNIRNAFTRDYATTWSIRNALSRDYATTWNVLAGFSRDYATTWSVRNAFTRDYVTTWNVIANEAFIRDYATTWNIRGLFQRDYVTFWNIFDDSIRVADVTAMLGFRVRVTNPEPIPASLAPASIRVRL